MYKMNYIYNLMKKKKKEDLKVNILKRNKISNFKLTIISFNFILAYI
jgi:hypothetical protein